jgi:hypothetical protein
MRKLKSDARCHKRPSPPLFTFDGQRPAPLRLIEPGLLMLPVIWSMPFHGPLAMGEKTIATLQLFPAAID